MTAEESASELFKAQIDRSERVKSWALSAGRRIKFTEGVRSLLVAGNIQLAREHQAAMTDLAKARHHASLLALTRPVYEAYVWAAWTLRVASEEQLQRLAANRLTRGLEKMLRDLDEVKFIGSPMLPYMKPVIEKMDGFVHGGFHHLVHRVRAESVHPQYPDDLLVEALEIGNLFAVMAILEGPAIEPDNELGDQLLAEVNELLNLELGRTDSGIASS